MDLADFPPFDESVSARALNPGVVGKSRWFRGVYAPNLVQSNMPQVIASAVDAEISDGFTLRKQAESARAAWMRGKLQSMLLAYENWLDQRRQRELERYLAEAQNLADLEARMRRYTLRRLPFGLAGRSYD